MIAIAFGRRIQTVADKILQLVALRVVVKGITILFTSDDWDQYLPAIKKTFGFLWRPRRKSKIGRKKTMKYFLPANILYGIVKKIKDTSGKVIGKIRQVVRGSAVAVQQILEQSPVSYVLNTSFVERINGTFRAFCSRLVRKAYSFSKSPIYHDCHIVIVTAYYNFVKPHRTLSENSDKRTTPAMAARITDHCFTWEELCNIPIAV